MSEIEKLIKLCEMFNCSVDQILRGTMDFSHEAYSDIKIVTDEQEIGDIDAEILSQNRQDYITITLEERENEEFDLIPNAYKALLTYMSINGIKEKRDPEIISCYEHEYFDNKGIKFMDIYIAIE